MKIENHEISPKMVRQGDVLLVPVASQSMPIAPRPARVTALNPHGRLVLAEGETSAHEHTLSPADAELVRDGGKILLTIFRDTPLSVTDAHTGQPLARHTTIQLAGGLYEVRTQRRAEITPAGMPQRWSRVRD